MNSHKSIYNLVVHDSNKLVFFVVDYHHNASQTKSLTIKPPFNKQQNITIIFLLA